MIRLLLVRHGESEWNVAGRVQGHASGIALTEAGRRQAAAAAHRLRGRGASRLIASDLQRAVETAAIVGSALRLPVETTPALREQGLGDLEGRLARELTPEEPPEGVHLNEVRWGGGESVADVHRRLTGFCDRLRAESPGRTLVLVTHEGTIQVLLAVLAGRDHRAVAWDRVAPGQIVEALLR